MLWIGPRLSTLERLSVASFLANGHPVHLYAYSPLEGVPHGTSVRDGREILPENAVFRYPSGFGAGSPSAFANLFRYKLLLERGGTWCDTDMVCVRPLDFLDRMPYAFASQRMPAKPADTAGDRMNVCIMKAPAGCDLLRECYASAAATDRSTIAWGQTGPDLVTAIAAQLGLQRYALPPEVACPVDFFALQALLAPGPPLPAAAHAVHCWNEMWRANGLDKDAAYAPDSLFEQLKRRYGIVRAVTAVGRSWPGLLP
ncbi:MAG TPA: glycosyltransferase [Usitatibacter sp.]|nr:glycosyltransferase [Usitatibacter sp.]